MGQESNNELGNLSRQQGAVFFENLVSHLQPMTPTMGVPRVEQGVSSSMKVGYGQPGHPQVIDELIIGSGDDLLPLSGTAWMCITHTKCARALHSMGQLNCGHLPNDMVFMDPGLEAISWDAPL